MSLVLKNMELISESFEKMTETFEEVNLKVKNNMERKYKIGLVVKKDDEKNIKIGLEFTINLIQKEIESDRILTKTNVKFMCVFDDESKEIVEKIKSEKIESKELNIIVSELNNLAYPYIKEYIETKYKKANIEIKLPLELKKEN